MNRKGIFESIKSKPEVSVLIVGAGINGIGTFWDLALNGVDVLLIDRADFCSGASAASSHMAHGGIRYLENGEFRLVREAVRERNAMIQNAPHIVKPLPTTIPIFRRFSGLWNAPLKFLGLLDRPSERGSLVIKIGLMLYDAYTGRSRTVPRHRFLNRQDSLKRWPELSPEVVHTATYYDGAILQPERLGLELILDAEDESPRAHAVNYASLARREHDAVMVRDELTGEEYPVRPQILVNATGPWIDLTNHAVGSSTRFIGGTKGSHIVLAHEALRAAIGENEFFFENKDGRIVLIFPLYDRVLVGTSDIAVSDPNGVRCSEEEVDYFLDLVKRVFPSIELKRSHIVFRFSGVRPLAAGASKTTGQITRDHEIRVTPPLANTLPFPIYSLVGGKWTSWRAFSEQATDKCLVQLGMARQVHTRTRQIGGGRAYPTAAAERNATIEQIAAKAGGSIPWAEALFARYGTRALQLAAHLAQGGEASLHALPAFSRGEIAFIATQEKVVHLDDVVLRRSMLAMLGYANRQSLREIAEVVGQHVQWDAARREAEIARCEQLLQVNHQVQL